MAVATIPVTGSAAPAVVARVLAGSMMVPFEKERPRASVWQPLVTVPLHVLLVL